MKTKEHLNSGHFGIRCIGLRLILPWLNSFVEYVLRAMEIVHFIIAVYLCFKASLGVTPIKINEK